MDDFCTKNVTSWVIDVLLASSFFPFWVKKMAKGVIFSYVGEEYKKESRRLFEYVYINVGTHFTLELFIVCAKSYESSPLLITTMAEYYSCFVCSAEKYSRNLWIYYERVFSARVFLLLSDSFCVISLTAFFQQSIIIDFFFSWQIFHGKWVKKAFSSRMQTYYKSTTLHNPSQ